MDKALQMSTRSLDRQEDGHAERPTTQAELTPHLSVTVDRGQSARDKTAKEEIHAAGNKAPGLREGRDLAACLAGLH